MTPTRTAAFGTSTRARAQVAKLACARHRHHTADERVAQPNAGPQQRNHVPRQRCVNRGCGAEQRCGGGCVDERGVQQPQLRLKDASSTPSVERSVTNWRLRKAGVRRAWEHTSMDDSSSSAPFEVVQAAEEGSTSNLRMLGRVRACRSGRRASTASTPLQPLYRIWKADGARAAPPAVSAAPPGDRGGRQRAASKISAAACGDTRPTPSENVYRPSAVVTSGTSASTQSPLPPPTPAWHDGVTVATVAEKHWPSRAAHLATTGMDVKSPSRARRSPADGPPGGAEYNHAPCSRSCDDEKPRNAKRRPPMTILRTRASDIH